MRLSPLEQRPRGGEAVDDARERLVDLVGKRGCHLADGHHTRAAQELLLERPMLPHVVHALRQVVNAQQRERRSIGSLKICPVKRIPTPRASAEHLDPISLVRVVILLGRPPGLHIIVTNRLKALLEAGA